MRCLASGTYGIFIATVTDSPRLRRNSLRVSLTDSNIDEFASRTSVPSIRVVPPSFRMTCGRRTAVRSALATFVISNCTYAISQPPLSLSGWSARAVSSIAHAIGFIRCRHDGQIALFVADARISRTHTPELLFGCSNSEKHHGIVRQWRYARRTVAVSQPPLHQVACDRAVPVDREFIRVFA